MLHPLLQDQETNVRTQISLTRAIKRAVEIKGKLLGESLSEYLRKAAVIRIMAEEEEDRELALAAKNFIGAGTWKKNHPRWKNKTAVEAWRKKLRAEWS